MIYPPIETITSLETNPVMKKKKRKIFIKLLFVLDLKVALQYEWCRTKATFVKHLNLNENTFMVKVYADQKYEKKNRVSRVGCRDNQHLRDAYARIFIKQKLLALYWGLHARTDTIAHLS